ncbi:hypothetical protein J6590_001304 [Homalodisca vitripennis]|nr:hypothetical protein J6590_001304 [Homalodisca vitripennis]
MNDGDVRSCPPPPCRVSGAAEATGVSFDLGSIRRRVSNRRTKPREDELSRLSSGGIGKSRLGSLQLTELRTIWWEERQITQIIKNYENRRMLNWLVTFSSRVATRWSVQSGVGSPRASAHFINHHKILRTDLISHHFVSRFAHDMRITNNSTRVGT